METAVSIPDDVFEQAEELTRRLSKSRGELYADALRDYLARHDDEGLTEEYNRLADDVDMGLDQFLTLAAWHTLKRVEWD